MTRTPFLLAALAAAVGPAAPAPAGPLDPAPRGVAQTASAWAVAGLAGGPVYALDVMPVVRDRGTVGADQQVVAGGNIVLTSGRGAEWVARPGSGVVARLQAAADGVIFASSTSQVWRSVNYGRDWVPIRVRGDEPAQVVAVSPAFQSDGLAFAATTADWRMFRADKRTNQWTEVVLKPGERYSLGAAAFSPQFETDETAWVGADAGVFRSGDSGQTWTQVAAPGPGVPAFAEAGGPLLGQGIVVPPDYGDDPANRYDIVDRTIFAFNAAGAHRSDDAGATWRRLPLEGIRVRDLAVSNAWPADPVVAVAGEGAGVVGAVSRDGGATWSTIPGPPGIAGTSVAMALDFGRPGFQVPPFPNLRGRAFMPLVVKQALDRVTYPTVYQGSREMVLATDGDGVWRSRDAGGTWDRATPNATLYNAQPTSLAPLPGGPTVLAGTGAAGLYASDDGGATWRWRDTPLPRGHGQTIYHLAVSPDFAADRTVFAAAQSGVWVSRDAGVTWSRTSGPAPAPSLDVSPAFAGDRTLAAAGHVSTDGGQTWTPLPGSFAWTAVAFSPKYGADRTLWAGRAAEPDVTLDYRLYRSTDGGQLWTPIEVATLRGLYVHDIEPIAVAADPIRVFVATDRGPVVSLDGGETWRRVEGIPARATLDIDSVSLTLPYATGVVAMATENGITWSTNRGLNWSTTPREIRGPTRVAIAPDGRAIYGALPVAVTRYGQVLDAR